ncbi:MAG: ComEC/Rec2 family competence protein [Patescibacteria group bacterium]|jgi:competence protein ComEC
MSSPSGAVIIRHLSLGFLAGIAASSFLFFVSWPWSLIGGIISFGFVMMFDIRFFSSELRIEKIICQMLGIGFAVFVYASTFPSIDSIVHETDTEGSVEGTIIDLEESEFYQKATLADLSFEDQERSDRLLVYLPLYPTLSYGDRLSFTCTPRAPEPIEGFAYNRYLWGKDIYAECFLYATPLVIARDAGNPVMALLQEARISLLDRIQMLFGEPESSLLAGLFIGETNFSTEWEAVFQKTGTSHIVAASGYNVGIVTIFLLSFFSWIGWYRRQTFFLVAVAIVFYAILCGAEAAIVRAAVMGLLVLLSQQLGRRSAITNILLLTASILLLFSPRALRDDIGFELSMAATMGLIYLTPFIKPHLAFIPKTLHLQESFASTIAATIACAPILLFRFGTFSLVSPMVNLLILPWLPYLMIGGAVILGVSVLSSSLAILLSGFVALPLSGILFLVRACASIPISAFAFPDWCATLLTLLFGILLWLLVRNHLFSARSRS